eukprot:2787583-Amphidinium_carterae.1
MQAACLQTQRRHTVASALKRKEDLSSLVFNYIPREYLEIRLNGEDERLTQSCRESTIMVLSTLSWI